MEQPTILLTSPTRAKAINLGYPGNLENLLDTRLADKFSPESAYELSGWFRRCVDTRADALASIPFTIRRLSSGRILYDSTGFRPLPDMLRWLADLETLLKLTEASLVTIGAAYWIPVMRRGVEQDMQWVDPRLMEPIYGPTGEIVSYERTIYRPDAHAVVPEKKRIPADKVIAFFYRDPFTEVGPGNSLAKAARVNADVLHSLDVFLDNYMDRGLLPATIVAVPANTPPEERNRFQQWWDKMYRGKNRAGTQKVLNADAVKVEKIGDGIGQLGASEIVKQQREAIATALGVPMSMLLPEGGSRQSLQDDEHLYVKTVIPEAKRIMADLNRGLFFDRGFYFRFEFKRIEALQRSMLETARGMQRVVEGPVLTQNEGRQILGYERDEDEKSDLLQKPQPEMGRLGNETSTLAVQEAQARPGDDQTKQFVDDEIAKWRRKALNKGLDAPFVCEYIPPHIEGEIRRRIRLGESAEKVFAEPFEQY